MLIRNFIFLWQATFNKGHNSLNSSQISETFTSLACQLQISKIHSKKSFWKLNESFHIGVLIQQIIIFNYMSDIISGSWGPSKTRQHIISAWILSYNILGKKRVQLNDFVREETKCWHKESNVWVTIFRQDDKRKFLLCGLFLVRGDWRLSRGHLCVMVEESLFLLLSVHLTI